MAGNTELMTYLLENGAPTSVLERLMQKMESQRGNRPLMSTTRPGYGGNVGALKGQPQESEMFRPPQGVPRR